MHQLRAACAEVARNARHVHLVHDAIAGYAAALPAHVNGPDADSHLHRGSREELAAFWLTLDAINFGSGWFPTLRKPPGRSGYATVAAGVRERFARGGPWSASELAHIEVQEIAEVLGQHPGHELMALFARSLRDLGERTCTEADGRFEALVGAAGGSAVALAWRLGGWPSFADTSRYDGIDVPFLKRAQIAAADLARAGVASFADLDQLTMFADNLVPHVLRLDGILRFDAGLVARIDRGELVAHDSPEEIEIRACAVHAVELIVAARPGRPAAEVDQILWNRGQQPRYKASPRHRCRCTAY